MAFKFLFMPPYDERTADIGRLVGERVPDAKVIVARSVVEAEREIADAEAAYGVIPQNMLARAQRLSWLQVHQAAPAAGYYYPDLVAHPAVVTNMRGIFGDRIPAHIMAFLLTFARGMHVYFRRQLERRWSRTAPAPVVHLPDATALIVGVGDIGAETAKLCAAFGIHVVGVDARRSEAPAGVSAMYSPDALGELLPSADFVIVTVPHTPETEGVFNAEMFRRMKNSAFFINIGRGMTTRIDDLNQALRAGVIAGAGLDVFEIEPLPPDHPLWDAPNLLLTPHVAADGPTLEPRKADLVSENARRFARGEELLNVVDKSKWF